MGDYMFVLAACVNCRATITINPERCPSLRVNGEREPLCRVCFDKWNVIHRTSKGLAPEPIHPDAYEPAACDSVGDGLAWDED